MFLRFDPYVLAAAPSIVYYFILLFVRYYIVLLYACVTNCVAPEQEDLSIVIRGIPVRRDGGCWGAVER